MGAPDPERLHRGAKLAGRAAVYTHRDPAQLLAQYAGQRIHRATELPVYSFERNLIGAIAGKLERRNSLSVTVTERQLYLDLGGENHTVAITEQRAG